MPPSLPTSDSNGSAITAILLKPAVAVPLALSLFLIYILYPVVLDPLRSIPGPFLSRFTRLWELRMLLKGNFEEQNIDLHRKHGTGSLHSSEATLTILSEQVQLSVWPRADTAYKKHQLSRRYTVMAANSSSRRSTWHSALWNPMP